MPTTRDSHITGLSGNEYVVCETFANKWRAIMFNIFTTLLKANPPTVDLIMNQTSAHVGETISGCFYLNGGRKTQKIKRLECSLVKEFDDGSVETVEEVTTILMSKELCEGEKLEFPFRFLITEKFEPTTSNITYRFHTNLVYSENLTSKDHDELVIVPSEHLKNA